MDDISIAIHEAVSEISDPYGDTWKHPVLEQRSREWHIGRIIYFINHPMEIRDIEIDNEYAEGIYRALAVLGYKSEKMAEIGKRI